MTSFLTTQLPGKSVPSCPQGLRHAPGHGEISTKASGEDSTQNHGSCPQAEEQNFPVCETVTSASENLFSTRNRPFSELQWDAEQ